MVEAVPVQGDVLRGDLRDEVTLNGRLLRISTPLRGEEVFHADGAYEPVLRLVVPVRPWAVPAVSPTHRLSVLPWELHSGKELPRRVACMVLHRAFSGDPHE